MSTPSASVPSYVTSRLRWLMLSRVIIVTFLFALAVFTQFKEMESLASIPASFLFRAVLLTYVLTLLFLLLLRWLPYIQVNLYIQATADVALITATVYATGGIHSLYSVFYPLVIIYAVLFLGRRGGLIIASAAGIFYGLFADLEFYGVIYPLFPPRSPAFAHSESYVFTRIVTHILSFYFIAFLAIFVVEQEKKTRQLLEEKESAFEQLDLLHRSIIESIDTGILTVNLDQRVKSFNRAAAEITGLSFRDVENRPFADVFPEAPKLGSSEAADRPFGKTRFEIPFSSGRRSLTLGGSISPLRDQQGRMIGHIILFQDLTELNQMRDTIERNRRLAYTGEMAASLAHEIRNPLASISGSLQLLREEMVFNDTSEKLLRIIFRGKEQLESFLKDFLLMARPAPGQREQVLVNDLLREVLDSLRCTEDWPASLEEEILLPAEPLHIEANKSEIRQVIWNLLLNAVQSMPEGGRLQVRLSAVRQEDAAGLEIAIVDEGLGIAKEDLSRIFEPFFTTREKGTGLGLAVVNRIIETYRGRISVESQPGRGTRCTVWLPFGDSTAAKV